MKDSEFLTEIKARKELEAMGYRWVTCDNCKGKKEVPYVLPDDYKIPAHMTRDDYGNTIECWKCGGKGKVWISPEHSKTLDDTANVNRYPDGTCKVTYGFKSIGE